MMYKAKYIHNDVIISTIEQAVQEGRNRFWIRKPTPLHKVIIFNVEMAASHRYEDFVCLAQIENDVITVTIPDESETTKVDEPSLTPEFRTSLTMEEVCQMCNTVNPDTVLYGYYNRGEFQLSRYPTIAKMGNLGKVGIYILRFNQSIGRYCYELLIVHDGNKIVCVSTGRFNRQFKIGDMFWVAESHLDPSYTDIISIFTRKIRVFKCVQVICVGRDNYIILEN